MRENTPDPFVLEKLMGRAEGNKTINKHENKEIEHKNNKPIRQQKNITFSLSAEVIALLESSWLTLRKSNPKATKTAIVESSLKKALSDLGSIEL